MLRGLGVRAEKKTGITSTFLLAKKDRQSRRLEAQHVRDLALHERDTARVLGGAPDRITVSWCSAPDNVAAQESAGGTASSS
jgi:hypothetical protein